MALHGIKFTHKVQYTPPPTVQHHYMYNPNARIQHTGEPRSSSAQWPPPLRGMLQQHAQSNNRHTTATCSIQQQACYSNMFNPTALTNAAHDAGHVMQGHGAHHTPNTTNFEHSTLQHNRCQHNTAHTSQDTAHTSALDHLIVHLHGLLHKGMTVVLLVRPGQCDGQWQR